MGRHVCRELLLYLTPIRLLQENTNYYSSRMGCKIKDLPSLSHTLSKRRKKEFANKIKIVRELFFDCLSRIWKDPYYPSATGPGDSVPSAFFFSFFPSSLLVLLVHTSYIVTNRNHRTVNERYLYADF